MSPERLILGVYQERAGALEPSRREFEPAPSRSLAWILGVLAMRGDFSARRISVESKYEDFTEAFRLTGEGLFGINSHRSTSSKNGTRVRFYSSKVTEWLGNISRPIWPRTIIEKHGWILDNQEYIWGFLEGAFDATGYLGTPRRGKLYFYTRHVGAVNFIMELLTRSGVERPAIDRDRKRIKGACVANLPDIKYIAENLHSKLPRKEVILELFRKCSLIRTSRLRRYPFDISKEASKDEVLAEWVRLTSLLGHEPSSTDIKKLKAEGRTKYSTSVYISRFGNKTFLYSSDNLKKAVFAPQINAVLELYRAKSGREVKYTPKLHITNDQRQQEEQAKKRLEEILERPELSQVPSLLVAPDGKLIASPQERLEPGPSIIESIPRLGKTGRKILNALLASSQKPILSSELVKIVYGSDVDLETGRQRIRMMIYKVLNPALKKLGFSIVNTAQSKTATEALYQLRKIDSMVELPDIKQGVKPVKRYENLVRWSEEDEVFKIELPVPDKKILKTDSEFKARFVAKFVQNKTASMVELCNDFYGEYNHRNADNITHMVLRANRLLESIGWRIVQLTHPRDFRLGQKAVYSLEEIRQQAVA